MSTVLLAKFVTYQKALKVVAVAELATASWKGWAPLVDQVRRAASSVVLNLAEGNAHPRDSKERRRFQRIAFGSAVELSAALDIAAAATVGNPTTLATAATESYELVALLNRLTQP